MGEKSIGHGIVKCRRCGKIIAQCRCIGHNKPVHYKVCEECQKLSEENMDIKLCDRRKKIEDGTIGRGMLTTDVDKIAKIFIGRGISLRELRLIPYIQYVMCNERRLEIAKVNQEERKILKKWKEEGHIEGGASGLAVTKRFWDFMCEVLFVAYVGYDNPEYEINTK